MAAVNIYDPNKFMKGSEWTKREFVPGSEPNNRVLRKKIDSGELIGYYNGGGTYERSDQRCYQSASINQAVNNLIRESANG